MAIARVSLADLGLRSERIGREVLLGVGGLVVYLGCFAAIVWACLPDSATTFHAVLAWSLPQRALFLMIGIAIAVFEESVFRGYLQPTLIHRLGYVGGIAVTAVVFAAWHPPLFSVAGFLVRLSLGLVTGLSRGRDRPLTAAITTHALLWAALGLA
jgi:membrane protease YdiL (CAAX protease family)